MTDDLGAYEDAARLAEVDLIVQCVMMGTLTDGHERVAGPPFVRYHAMDDAEADVELGVPVVEAVAGEGRVVSGELPGGPAVTTWHLGAHDRLGEAYARLRGWMSAQGCGPRGAAWEVYTWIDPPVYRGPENWSDPASWRTQLVWPVSEPGHASPGVDTGPL